MDSRGHWHHEDPADERIRQAFSEKKSEMPERPVISIAIGEMVCVVKNGGEHLYATFDAAEKNKVTLTPADNGQPRPYLELAEHVQLQRANGEGVAAQVWDNRGGKLILRTLPI